jgi:phospholipase/carboxylesterase
VEQVAALIRQRVGHPVAVTGFSQGGVLSFALAVRHPELVTLAVPLSGGLPASLIPTAGPPPGAPPIRALHGNADDRIPVAMASRTVESLAARGWDAQLQTWDGVPHTVTPEMRRVLVRMVEEGGGR